MTSIKKNHVVNCINYANENRLFDKLNNIYKSLPSGDCSGCGNCCMESVGTNLIEFINIYNYLENKPELKKVCLDKIIDYYFLEYIDKKPCPFKDKDNRCMIYEVRPLNCRLFGHWKKEDYIIDSTHEVVTCSYNDRQVKYSRKNGNKLKVTYVIGGSSFVGKAIQANSFQMSLNLYK